MKAGNCLNYMLFQLEEKQFGNMVRDSQRTSAVIACLLFVLGNMEFTRGVDVTDNLLDRMIQVESGGDECAVGDHGRSLGPLQIMKAYYKDATEQNPRLLGGGRRYADVGGTGSTKYAKEVTRSYMDRYATKDRLGHSPTDEDVARIHNGGPNGFKKSATEAYWEKVRKASPFGHPDPMNVTIYACSSSSFCSGGQCCNSKGTCHCFELASSSWNPCYGSQSYLKPNLGHWQVIIALSMLYVSVLLV